MVYFTNENLTSQPLAKTDDITLFNSGQDLHDRIRALLLSRSRNYPPKPPSTTPVLSSLHSVLLAPNSGISRLSSVNHAIQLSEGLLGFEERQKDMVVKYFDLTGFSESNGMEHRRRQMSQPLLYDDRSVVENAFYGLEINQKSLDGTLGRERSEIYTIDPKTLKTIKASEAKNPHTPRYVLTVPTLDLPRPGKRSERHAFRQPAILNVIREPVTSIDPITVTQAAGAHASEFHSHLSPRAAQALGELGILSFPPANSRKVKRSKSCSSFREPTPPLGTPISPIAERSDYPFKDFTSQFTDTNQTIRSMFDQDKEGAKKRVQNGSTHTLLSPTGIISKTAASGRDMQEQLHPQERSISTKASGGCNDMPNDVPASDTPSKYSSTLSTRSKRSSSFSLHVRHSVSGYPANEWPRFGSIPRVPIESCFGLVSAVEVPNIKKISSLGAPLPSRNLIVQNNSLSEGTFVDVPRLSNPEAAEDVTHSVAPRSPSLPMPFKLATPPDTADKQRSKRSSTLPVQSSRNLQPLNRGFNSKIRGSSFHYGWFKHFLKRPTASNNLEEETSNLTARRPPRHQTFFGEYMSRRPSELVSDNNSNSSSQQKLRSDHKSGVDAEEIRSMSPEALERIIKELESVLKEALEIAHEAADKTKAQSDTPAGPERTISGYSYDNVSNTCKERLPSPQSNVASASSAVHEADMSPSVARMKHRVHIESYPSQDRAREFQRTIKEYHKALTGLHNIQTSVETHNFGSSTVNHSPILIEADIGAVDSRSVGSIPSSKFAGLDDSARSLHQSSVYYVKMPPPLHIAAHHDVKNTVSFSKTQTPQFLFDESTLAGQEILPAAITCKFGSLSSAKDVVERELPPTPLGLPSSLNGIDRVGTNPNLNADSDARTQLLQNTKASDQPIIQESKLANLTFREHEALDWEQVSSPKALRQYMKIHDRPPVFPRGSSNRHRYQNVSANMGVTRNLSLRVTRSGASSGLEHYSPGVEYVADFHRNRTSMDGTERDDNKFVAHNPHSLDLFPNTKGEAMDEIPLQEVSKPSVSMTADPNMAFKDRGHQSIRGYGGFSLNRSHKRSPIARDWSNPRKRFTAAIACMSAALVGITIGIYAGEAPAIQYAVVDENHRFIYLGNVFLYLGLAISNFLFWPLPLLHGRKPYTLSAFAIMLPLLFPQAMAVASQRSPYDRSYRVGLLLPRFLAGFALGIANMNFIGVLLDLFGSSLQSGNPHQEIVNPNDARRHGGGMGAWLSIWTWCYIGSIGFGFFLGALIIGYLNVAWGFWIVIILTLVVILINVAAPETRRSAYRRSLAQVRRGDEVSRRVGKGEIMMHLYATGPRYWWQECLAGYVLCARMLRQPGFLVISLYQAWIYGQVVMVMILLGALTSKYYQLYPRNVALCIAAFPLGALVAIPFQQASLFSRARHHNVQRTDSMTIEKRIIWTEHFGRRIAFMIALPLAGLAYTFASRGESTLLVFPVLFSVLIGFLSNLALSECSGLIMENFDTSDLQPGMTGRPRKIVSEDSMKQRTNFSCYPRVTAGFAITQSLAFVIAAAATACGGHIERRLGAQASTAVVAGVLVILSLLLGASLIRFKTVQIVPSNRVPTSVLSGPGENLPIIIGNPSGTTRKVSLLELGALTRWTEIRKRNKLLDGGKAKK